MAGVGSRFLAIAVDTLYQGLLYAVVLLIVFAGGIVAGDSLAWIPSSISFAIAIFLAFCLYWGYYAFFEILWKGQTPGKRLAGIRVIKNSGRPANVYETIGRNLLRSIDWLPGLYAVGVCCMIFDKQNRRLGDFIAGTVVVHEKRSAELPTWMRSSPSAEASAHQLPAGQLSAMTPEELMLVETYLSRRAQLDPNVRTQTRLKIARRITDKTGAEPAPGQSVDAFLEMVARQVRDEARYR